MGRPAIRLGLLLPRSLQPLRSVAAKCDDPHLKSVVIEAAQRLRRYEPRWRELSALMAARGKPTSVIVGAVANRWLRGLYHQMKELPMAA